ncbi:MAG: TatD family hydrolase [Candidatus Eutrophobiaceae bacterium]
MQFSDSHCHLQLIEEKMDVEQALQQARDAGVVQMLCVAVELSCHKRIKPFAERCPEVRISAGVHPNHAPGEAVDWDRLRSQLADEATVAVGETGLDGFRSEGDLDWQRERFRRHIQLAIECGKPLIIHSRESKADTIRILREEGAQKVGGVMHCFVDDLETAHAAMELGFFISISGIVTFKNARELQETVRKLPLERMLIETDSPYLSPEPFRGKTNHPAMVRRVAEKIAELKEIETELVADQTNRNYCAFIGKKQVCSGNAD